MGVFNIAGEIATGAFGIVDCIVKNTCCDIVRPRLGSVLRCDLVGGIASHTGVCVGHSEIAEITEVRGRAKVMIVSPHDFLSASLLRTGCYIYVASAEMNGKMRALGSSVVARRARRLEGTTRGDYYTLCNNCHQFTRYCITGVDDESSTPWGVDDIVEALKEEFCVDDVCWRSTGLTADDEILY